MTRTDPLRRREDPRGIVSGRTPIVDTRRTVVRELRDTTRRFQAELNGIVKRLPDDRDDRDDREGRPEWEGEPVREQSLRDMDAIVVRPLDPATREQTERALREPGEFEWTPDAPPLPRGKQPGDAYEVAAPEEATDPLELAAQVAEGYAERLKHTSHRDGLGMGWQAGEELCRIIAARIRSEAPTDATLPGTWRCDVTGCRDETAPGADLPEGWRTFRDAAGEERAICAAHGVVLLVDNERSVVL